MWIIIAEGGLLVPEWFSQFVPPRVWCLRKEPVVTATPLGLVSSNAPTAQEFGHFKIPLSVRLLIWTYEY